LITITRVNIGRTKNLLTSVNGTCHDQGSLRVARPSLAGLGCLAEHVGQRFLVNKTDPEFRHAGCWALDAGRWVLAGRVNVKEMATL
jgi:hypothetical protein